MSELGVVFLCFTMAIFGLSIYIITKQQQQHEQERNEWQTERKDLLDRIQAPTFAEYTNKVVRLKKAEQPQEEEQPIQFVT